MQELPTMSPASWIMIAPLVAFTAYWVVHLIKDAMWRRKYRKGRVKISRMELIQIFQNLNYN